MVWQCFSAGAGIAGEIHGAMLVLATGNKQPGQESFPTPLFFFRACMFCLFVIVICGGMYSVCRQICHGRKNGPGSRSRVSTHRESGMQGGWEGWVRGESMDE